MFEWIAIHEDIYFLYFCRDILKKTTFVPEHLVLAVARATEIKRESCENQELSP